MGNRRPRMGSTTSGSSSSSKLRLRAFWWIFVFAFAGVLHSSPSSFSVVHAEEETSSATADVVVAPAEEEETETTINNNDVCAPVVMDCSKHEETIAELTESLEALQGTLDAQIKESRDELSMQMLLSLQECKVRIDDLHVAHQAELTAAIIDKNNKSDKKDAKVSQLQAQLDAAQDEAGKWQEQHDDVSKENEKLTLQLEETSARLESLQKEHDRVIQESQKLAASVRDMEQRAAGTRQVEAKRKRDLDKERERAKARLEASQNELFETRQELHDVWERYVAIRDAWWNVPSRWESVASWATLQWERFDAQVDRILVVVKPHVDRCGRIIATTIETILRKVSWFVNVLHLVINDWFLPNWRLHVQPHLDRTGRFCAAHARELGSMANERRIAVTAWAAKEWSTLMTATEPQREQVAQLLQPTIDVLRAQFGPAWTALHSAYTAAYARVAESTCLEATAVALYRAEHHVVSAVATATSVARDYLVLQNAPTAAIQPLQWIHRQAAAHAATSAAGASAGVPPPHFLRNVLMTATTATALILTVLWLVARTKRPSSPPRRRPRQPPPPSSPPPPYRTPPMQAGHKPSRNNNNKPASPDLLTEASSIPDGSLRTPVTRPR